MIKKHVSGEIAKQAYVSGMASQLEEANPGSTIFDLRDELQQSLDVVNDLISRYGESVKLTDTTTPPIEKEC